MPWRIVYFDNDRALRIPYVARLRDAGHEVAEAQTYSEAMQLLARPCDLLVLDVMIPTISADEERLFPPALTEKGLMGGLAFYRWVRQQAALEGMRVLVVTARMDITPYEEFLAAGLPAACFVRYFNIQLPSQLVRKVEEVMAGTSHAASRAS